MITVNVLYGDSPDSTFDMDYYLKKHMPMVGEKLGTALKGMSVEQGLRGAQPGTAATVFRVLATLQFDSVDAFERAFAPVANDILGDIPRYTNIAPTIQISEVKL